MKVESPKFGEHARPGRGGTRPAFRTGNTAPEPNCLEDFARRPFSARARKTARGARALPVPLRSPGSTQAGFRRATPANKEPHLCFARCAEDADYARAV